MVQLLEPVGNALDTLVVLLIVNMMTSLRNHLKVLMSCVGIHMLIERDVITYLILEAHTAVEEEQPV